MTKQFGKYNQVTTRATGKIVKSKELDSNQRRVSELWSWLPAFRAVAEREHVQNAARDLHVTASSLSRAIGLIEHSLGKKLFDRVGRNVKLNHDGAALLASLRDGMRRIDDGVSTVLSTQLVGELHVGCEGDQPVDLVWKAIFRLQAEAPLLTASVHDLESSDVAARLLRGDLDLAIVGHARRAENVRIEHVATISYGIYCGEGHALFHVRTASLDAIVRHPFVAPTLGRDLAVADRWPPSIARIVSLRLPALEPAIAACASGRALAVLPDAAVELAPGRGSLRRLPSDVIEPSELYAVRRQPLGTLDRAGALVAALTTEIARAGLEPTRVGESLRRKPNRGRR